MSRDRYEALSRNVHMSDPDEDTINDTKTGTSERDRLFRVKPLMETIQKACRPFYHPSRSLVVDERMVPCKGHSRRNGTIRDTPTKCCFKLFVLTDSSNRYTVDFSVYTGKNNFSTGRGLSYDSVMSLIDRRHLGSGYHVHMDSFFMSPKLFRDSLASEFGACGTCRDSRSDCQRTDEDVTQRNVPLDTGRSSSLCQVGELTSGVCLLHHPRSYSEYIVQGRVKHGQPFPCPAPVNEYHKHMGGLESSNQLIQNYTLTPTFSTKSS